MGAVQKKDYKTEKKAWREEQKIHSIMEKRLKRGLPACFEKKFIRFVCSHIENEVISARVRYLLSWYDSNANLHKDHYNIMRTLGYVLTSAITFLSVLFSMLSNIIPNGGVVISQVGFGVTALISFLITIISHRIDHRRYYENWVRYRSSAEDIKKECILFINKCGEDYSSGNQKEIEKAFICNIEKIADKETDSWKSLVADSDNQSHNGQARTPDVRTERIDDSDESKIIKKNESLTK